MSYAGGQGSTPTKSGICAPMRQYGLGSETKCCPTALSIEGTIKKNSGKLKERVSRNQSRLITIMTEEKKTEKRL
jgi:hypothetical protein